MIPSLEPFEQYAGRMTSPEPKVLRDLKIETYRSRSFPQMIAGPLQGRFLAMLAKISGARRILEIGTFVGYSALCFAEALPAGGSVVTLDSDPTIRPIAEKYFARVPYGRKIRILIGRALDLLPKIPGRFDLVYLDADKPNYGRYYEAVLPKISKGGLILADNIFWSGAVLKRQANDADTRALRAFARKVAGDSRVETILLTIRDGLMVIRKR